MHSIIDNHTPRTMSLADELLVDLSSGDEANVDESLSRKRQKVDPDVFENGNDENVLGGEYNFRQVKRVGDVAKLLESSEFRELVGKIRNFSSDWREKLSLGAQGYVENDPEYQLIIKANQIIVDIDNEILVVSKFLKEHYGVRFPELENLIPNPIDYANTVNVIGNDVDDVSIFQKLGSFLPKSVMMIVTVTASHSNGSILSNSELSVVQEACAMAIKLNSAREHIMAFVQSRMTVFAPNISALVGPGVAAKIIGAVGGLKNFCYMPSCNIAALGAKNRNTQTGFGSVGLRHKGFLYESDIIFNTPPDYQKQAQRILAAKLTLAARLDQASQSQDGSLGRQWRREVENKIEKLTDPPPNTGGKALPVPLEPIKKKRGGRRVRKAKEKYAQSEMRKLQNRMSFGKEEEEITVFDETEGLGMLTGAAALESGRIRGPVIDSRTKAFLPKALRNKSFGSNKQGESSLKPSPMSGLASSIAFTPIQGIELINPNLHNEDKTKKPSKYFEEGFMSTVRQ